MHLTSFLAGSLLLVSPAAASLAGRHGSACNEDNLYRCFIASTSLASQYCSKSVGLPGPTDTVFITPTVTSTSTVLITQYPDNLVTKAQGLLKRHNSSNKPLACTTYPASRLSSACSCLGITTAQYETTITVEPVTSTTTTTKYVSLVCPAQVTMTAACPAPVTVTQVVIQTISQTSTRSQTETQTSSATATVTQTSVSVSVSTVTETVTIS